MGKPVLLPKVRALIGRNTIRSCDYVTHFVLFRSLAQSFSGFNRSNRQTTCKTANSNTCILPPYPEHGTYEVAHFPDAQPSQSLPIFLLIVRCRREYGVVDPYADSNGTKQVYGEWYQKMPKCVHSITNFTIAINFTKANNLRLKSQKNQYSLGLNPTDCCLGIDKITKDDQTFSFNGHLHVPWLAATYTVNESSTSEVPMYICGGTLISDRYFVTVAYALQETSGYTLKVVLGGNVKTWTNESSIVRQECGIQHLCTTGLSLELKVIYQKCTEYLDFLQAGVGKLEVPRQPPPLPNADCSNACQLKKK
ncbi:unnamed protein product [Arctia plantaginis]|uniref:Uncharacterized protein n=1 Tax=Arctia plantaginis TaxID=874455 RepID=A0A8S0ZGW2_ARCPL|nr:unnamed protein product [Arctia plantaginis]